MPTIYEGLGTEELIDNIDAVMRQKLNDSIMIQEEIGNVRDVNRAMALGFEPVKIGLEQVQPQNYHVGSLPSFIQSGDNKVEDFPLLATVPGRVAPDPEDSSADQISVLQNNVNIHSFARANPNEGPEVAYRRAVRMSEAVYRVVVTDPLLRRVVSGISGPLAVDHSEPWYFPAQDGHGEDWCWVAVMHTYQVKNYSKSPQEV